MKVACEGAEKEIFYGLPSEIAARINTIVYEPDWRHYSVDDLNEHLQRLGYTTIKNGGVILAKRVPSSATC